LIVNETNSLFCLRTIINHLFTLFLGKTPEFNKRGYKGPNKKQKTEQFQEDDALSLVERYSKHQGLDEKQLDLLAELIIQSM
jgi:hypothetical protein